MTAGPPGTRLVVDAELRLDVDGVQAHITGRGGQLRLRTDHPVRLARAAVPLARHAGLRGGGTVLARLRQSGLVLTVSGPRRDLLHLDPARRRVHIPGLAPAAALFGLAVLIRLRRTALS